MWGFGVVQQLVTDAHTTDIYLGYRHYVLDVNLIDGSGAVADVGLQSLDAVMAGFATQF